MTDFLTDFLTLQQAAELTGYHRDTLRKLALAGEIPGAIRLNPRNPKTPWLIPASWVSKLIEGEGEGEDQ
jgi:hypothetical protein